MIDVNRQGEVWVFAEQHNGQLEDTPLELMSKARRLAERIEIHYTPKHGSWLNIAECELSVLSRHCLGNRTPSLRSLIHKVSPWTRERNSRQCGVDWQFTTVEARIKLKSLYPHIQLS